MAVNIIYEKLLSSIKQFCFRFTSYFSPNRVKGFFSEKVDEKAMETIISMTNYFSNFFYKNIRLRCTEYLKRNGLDEKLTQVSKVKLNLLMREKLNSELPGKDIRKKVQVGPEKCFQEVMKKKIKALKEENKQLAEKIRKLNN